MRPDATSVGSSRRMETQRERRSVRTSAAMVRSSQEAITSTPAVDAALSIRRSPPPAGFAGGSISTPREHGRAQTVSRIAAAFSPTPPVR
ncbi:MAG: hypothetical protein JWM18_3394 [Chloroflexi bacterium]|nr:hypothetical protein [Chloroflexota bacterium]